MRIENPYDGIPEGIRWLRGNLHAHTTRSDGRLEPQAVVDAYAAAGYDFLALTDHDVFTDDYSDLDAKGLVFLPGNEITRGGVHVVHVGGNQKIDPDPDRQSVLNSVLASRGFTVIAHPNWYARFNHCPQELLDTWSGYLGIEVYNGVIQWLEGSPYATDRWDMLLSAGRRVWGFAHDDFHWPSNLAQGWLCVAAEKTPDAIYAAIVAGRFYASTGVIITKLAVENTTISIATENAQRIVAVTKNAKRIAIVDAAEATIDVAELGRGYVRVECYGPGEAMAWTQPFWLHADDGGGEAL